MTAEEEIRANVKLVNDKFSSAAADTSPFGYDSHSVKRIDLFIEKLREHADRTADGTEKLIQIFGSWFGECIRNVYGGQWRKKGDQWGIFFDDSNAVYPFTKVRKQFELGVEGGESIHDFFEAIDTIFFHRT